MDKPELKRVKKVPMTSTWSCPSCNHQNVYREGIVSDPQNKCAVCGVEVIVGAIRESDLARTKVTDAAREAAEEVCRWFNPNFNPTLAVSQALMGHIVTIISKCTPSGAEAWQPN